MLGGYPRNALECLSQINLAIGSPRHQNHTLAHFCKVPKLNAKVTETSKAFFYPPRHQFRLSPT
jgi:hypothetical protein